MPKTPSIGEYVPDMPQGVGMEDTLQKSIERSSQRRQYELDNQNRRSPPSKRAKPRTPPIDGYIPDITKLVGMEDTLQRSMERSSQRRQHEIDNQNRRSPTATHAKKHLYNEKTDALQFIPKPIPARYSNKLLLSASEKNVVPGSRAHQILALRRSEIAGHDSFNSGMRVSESLSQLRHRLDIDSKSMSFSGSNTAMHKSSSNNSLPNIIRTSASVPTLNSKRHNSRQNNHQNKHNNKGFSTNHNMKHKASKKYRLRTKISSAPKTREELYDEYKKGKHRKVPVIKPGLPYRGLRSKKQFPSGYARKKDVVEHKHLYKMKKNEHDTIQDYHALTEKLGLLSMNVTGHVQEEDSDVISGKNKHDNDNNNNNSSILSQSQQQHNTSSIIPNNSMEHSGNGSGSGLLYHNSAIPPSTIGERKRRGNKEHHKMNSNYVKADPLSGSISRESSKGGGWWRNYDDSLLFENGVNDSSYFDSEHGMSSSSRPKSQGPFHFLFFDDKGREEARRTPYERSSFCPASPHGRRIYWEESVGHTVSLQTNGHALLENNRPYSSSYVLPPNTSKWGRQNDGSVYGPGIVETVVVSAPSHDKLLVAPLADPRSRESMRDPSFQLSPNATADPPSPSYLNTSHITKTRGDLPQSAGPVLMSTKSINGRNENDVQTADFRDKTFLTSGGIKLVSNQQLEHPNNGENSTAAIASNNDLKLDQFKPAKLFDQASIAGWDARSEASDGRHSRPTSSGSIKMGLNNALMQNQSLTGNSEIALARIDESNETNELHELKRRDRRSTKSKFCKLNLGIDVYVRLSQISGRQVTASEKMIYVPNGTTLSNMLNYFIKCFSLNKNLIWAVEHLRPGSSVWTPIENNKDWVSTFLICSSMIQSSKRKVILRVRRHAESSGFIKKADGIIVNTPGSLRRNGDKPRQSIREDVPTAMLSAQTFTPVEGNGSVAVHNTNNNNSNNNNELCRAHNDTNALQQSNSDVLVSIGGRFDIDTLEKQVTKDSNNINYTSSGVQLRSPISPVWDEMVPGAFDGWESNIEYDGAFSKSQHSSKSGSTILNNNNTVTRIGNDKSAVRSIDDSKYSIDSGGSSISKEFYDRMQYKNVSAEAKKVAYYLRSQRYFDSYEHHRDIAGRKPFYIPTNDPILDESFISSKLNVKGGMSMLQMEEVAASPVWNQRASINRKFQRKRYPKRQLPNIAKMKQFQKSILKKYSIQEKKDPTGKTIKSKASMPVADDERKREEKSNQGYTEVITQNHTMKNSFSFQTLYNKKQQNRYRLSMGFPTVEKKRNKGRRRSNNGKKLFLTEEDEGNF